MTFMMVGFADIIIFFVDIGLIIISIVILALFSKQSRLTGNKSLLWLPIIQLVMSLLVFLTVTVPRMACFIKFGVQRFKSRRANWQAVVRSVTLVIYILASILMIILNIIYLAVWKKNEEQSIKSYNTFKRMGYSINIIVGFIILLSSISLNTVIIILYRKHYKNTYSSNDDDRAWA